MMTLLAFLSDRADVHDDETTPFARLVWKRNGKTRNTGKTFGIAAYISSFLYLDGLALSGHFQEGSSPLQRHTENCEISSPYVFAGLVLLMFLPRRGALLKVTTERKSIKIKK
jgi:hypothetical protein